MERLRRVNIEFGEAGVVVADHAISPRMLGPIEARIRTLDE
jgi:hypothetical protein